MNAVTPGMTYSFPAPNLPVVFNHKVAQKLPDEELLSLAQLNILTPANLLVEINRRGLTAQFQSLIEQERYVPNN